MFGAVDIRSGHMKTQRHDKRSYKEITVKRNSLKIKAFWAVTPCSLIDRFTDVSKEPVSLITS